MNLPLLFLTPNEILSLWCWILLMGLSTGVSFANALKNAGRPLANVWRSMTALCGYWLASGIYGLFGGPFVMLYRIGIGAAAVLVVILYLRGDFKMDL